MSDNGDDTDGNTEDDPTFFAVGLDNDQDGIPDLLDIDDDNDGVLDTFEKCIDFSVDGFSFENYDTGGGGPVDSNTNYNSTFPVANKVAPFTSVEEQEEYGIHVWSMVRIGLHMIHQIQMKKSLWSFFRVLPYQVLQTCQYSGRLE